MFSSSSLTSRALHPHDISNIDDAAAMEDEANDDFPLAGLQERASVRRAHTTTSSGSRLYRLTGQQSSHSNSAGPVSPGQPGRNSSSFSANTASSPTVQGGASTSGLYIDSGLSNVSANAYPELLENDEENDNDDYDADERRLYQPATASLARHSSMPISRVLRRATNSGAQWDGNANDDIATALPASLEQRSRSNTAAGDLQRLAEGPISPIDQFASPLRSRNSGFVVTSRPSPSLRTLSGHPGQPLHSRSWSVNAGDDNLAEKPLNLSPSHSRHGSESLLRKTSDSRHQRSSSPSPTSPIDPGLLGQSNPWSPTPEEKQHLKQQSSPYTHLHSPSPLQDTANLRRNNSLTMKQPAPVPASRNSGIQQPQRRNTPLLPPLQTNPDALHTAVAQQQQTGSSGALSHSSSSHAPQQVNGGLRRAHSIKAQLRGPQSAAPYVPPIGHTHHAGSAFPSASSNDHTQARSQLPSNTSHIGRGVITAGPGLPQVNYLKDKERIAGTPASPLHPSSIPSATPASAQPALPFPSLSDPAQAAAFSNNLALQQQLLAAQTQQLQEQQAQLAAALQAGLSLNDASPAVPAPFIAQQETQNLAARIDALQKTNAVLAAATGSPASSPQPNYGAFTPFSPALPAAVPVQQPLNGYHPQQQQQPYHQQQQTYQTQQQQRARAQASTEVSPIDIPALIATKGYNPPDFDTRPANARFFVIKSFTEDDVFKSIKFEIWSSTALGNKRLDEAFKTSAENGPIYLCFSVNASGHFCGIAEMLTPLDYTVTSNVWAMNDKWKGVMKLRWIFIRDIPNAQLRHLKLTNTNEQKPVTSSRDTQEVPYEQGCEILRIFTTYPAKTTLLQDYAYYQSQAEQPAQQTINEQKTPHIPPSASFTPAFQGQQATPQGFSPGFPPGPLQQQQQQQQYYRSFTPHQPPLQHQQQQYIATRR